MTKRLLILNSLALASISGAVLMAAGKPGSTPTPPPAPPAPPAFTFDTDFDLPAGRTFGATGGGDSELAKKLIDVPAPNAEGKMASFLEAVSVPDTITDPKERDAAFKADCRKVTNRIGGAIRRLRAKDAYKPRNYAIRTVGDEKLGFGVRVWRTADTAAS